MQTDQSYMRRCFQLALNGRGTTYPNPLVGAVLVHQDKIIGEGWHRKSGEAHAEVKAIESVRDKTLLEESVLYVNLEPCSFYGKTPACSTLIIEKKIPKVVISMQDPHPRVSGSGINMLKKAGVEVVSGVLENEGRELNRIFIVNQLKKRPYIFLKWAQSSDGFMAPGKGSNKIISHLWSRQLVHRWRSEYQAILIGKNTLIEDNPLLDARLGNGQAPVPIILGGHLQAGDFNIFSRHKKIIWVTTNKAFHSFHPSLKVLYFKNLPQLLQDLYIEGIMSILVEGGPRVLQQFIETGLWDEAAVFTSPVQLQKGVSAPVLNRKRWLKTEAIGPDKLDIFASVHNEFIHEGCYI